MSSFNSVHVRAALGTVSVVMTGLMLSVSAQAAVRETPPHMTVRFNDLNPASSRDMQTLYVRLRHAAETVCGDDDDVMEIWQYREINQCEQQAVESAVSQINQPLLTALYDRHYPDAPMVSRVNVSVPRA